MADQEVDDHQIAIELELPGVADHSGHPVDRPEKKFLDFAVAIDRRKIIGQFEVIAELDIRLESVGRFGAIGDRTDRDR